MCDEKKSVKVNKHQPHPDQVARMKMLEKAQKSSKDE
jgi:hypothetical protein